MALHLPTARMLPISLNGSFGSEGDYIGNQGSGEVEWLSFGSSSAFSAAVGDYLDMAGKTAIVDGENNHPVALYTVESPDVRFEDVIVINTADNLNKENLTIEHKIDSQFVFVCEENSIKAVGLTTSEPALCGIKIKGNIITVSFKDVVPEEVVVKISGIRKHFKGVRFTAHTQEEMINNTEFWAQAHKKK